MKKQILLLLIVCLALSGYHCFADEADATSYFSISAQQTDAFPGETLRVRLAANADQLESTHTMAAFRVQVQYDSTKLSFLRTENSDQMQSGAFQSYCDGETVTGVYACDGISAPKLRGTFLTFVFSVAEDALPGQAPVTVAITQSADWSEQLIPQYDITRTVPLSIKPQISADAQLTDLVPSEGRLRPDFSSDLAEYTLRVDSTVSSVKFQADSANDATVRVNRRTLLRAGETTDIVVTVTAADKKTKSQYLVQVIRAEKPPAEEVAVSDTSAVSKPSQPAKEAKSAEKTSSSSKKSKATASKATASKSASSKTSSKKATAKSSPAIKTEQTVAEQQAQPVNAAPAGERNLYIVGGQTDALPLWIISGCVVVLTIILLLNHLKSKAQK